MAKLEIEITAELSAYLNEQAATRSPSEEWILQTIIPTEKISLAEAIAPYVVPIEGRGPLPKRPENDHGAQFAEALVAKKQGGHF